MAPSMRLKATRRPPASQTATLILMFISCALATAPAGESDAVLQRYRAAMIAVALSCDPRLLIADGEVGHLQPTPACLTLG